MLCKVIKNKRYWYFLMLAGAVSASFGIIGILTEPDVACNIAMLLGMFTGIGAALLVFGVIRLLYMKFAPAAKLKAEEINMKDERNVQVGRAAGAWEFIYRPGVAGRGGLRRLPDRGCPRGGRPARRH
jgi:hypothetical protein